MMVTKAALQFNGITIVYVMGFVNAALACLGDFGINLTDTQQGAITTLVNAALILIGHVSHRVGEVAPTPGVQQAVQQASQQAQTG